MPQASPELAAQWRDDDEAVKFLSDAGYELKRGFYWLPPDDRNDPTNREYSAIRYLIEEWDYDGIHWHHKTIK